jgi:PHD/YefM family antitoxin component YafN of YafNO toxin-antitoxin module
MHKRKTREESAKALERYSTPARADGPLALPRIIRTIRSGGQHESHGNGCRGFESVWLFSRQALQEPVTITNHGHASLVLLSHAEYERLKRRDRAVLTLGDFTLDDRVAVAASVAPDEARSFDREVDIEG